MSKHDWKPGDVALRVWDGMTPQIAVVVGETAYCSEDHEVEPHWHMDGGWDPLDADDVHGRLTFRPIVVIDPGDREQVGRLLDALAVIDTYTVEDAAPALRSLVSPPRPPEPQGLGAVVEDTDGDLLVHIGNGDWVTAGGESVPWPAIAVAALRSDGVPL